MRYILGFLILVPAFAQSSQDASALLARQAEELQRHHSYQFTQDMQMNISMPGIPMPAITYSTVTQAVNPGKMRTEAQIPGMGGMISVSDGTQTWMYMPLLKQYTRIDDSTAGNITSGIGMPDLPDAKDLAANAKVTGSELLEVDGQQHDCWVLESRVDRLAAPGQAAAMQDAVLTYWVDKTLGLQLKMSMSGKVQASAATPPMEMRMVTTTHSLKFDEALPDSLFVFTPPADAKETKELFPGMQAALGTASPKASAPKPPAPGEPEAFIPRLSPIHRVEPVYPPEARSKGLQGFVEVLLTLDPTGAVVNAEPLSGPDALRPAALDAVKQWAFRPAVRNGHAVAAYTDVSVDFSPEWDVVRRMEALSKSNGNTVPDDAPGVGLEPVTVRSAVKVDDLGFDFAAEMKGQQRIQELTAKFPRTPEQVLADTQDQQRGATGIERQSALPDLARQALDAGELAQASSYATELLQTASDGTETYTGNTILGLVALREGSVSQARQYLLESAKTRASREFDPFGPDFTLARELLAKGERDAVLEFLTLAKGFWKSGTEQLDGMLATVRSGKTF